MGRERPTMQRTQCNHSEDFQSSGKQQEPDPHWRSSEKVPDAMLASHPVFKRTPSLAWGGGAGGGHLSVRQMLSQHVFKEESCFFH